MKPNVTWILIADGARARIVEHRGPGSGLHEVPGSEFSEERLRSADLISDRPGRTFSSTDQRRSAIERHVDPVSKQEAAFVTMLAEKLDAALLEQSFNRLIIAAAPRAMGDLRKALSPKVRKAVIAELSKDLTQTPNSQIAKHFDDVIAV